MFTGKGRFAGAIAVVSVGEVEIEAEEEEEEVVIAVELSSEENLDWIDGRLRVARRGPKEFIGDREQAVCGEE